MGEREPPEALSTELGAGERIRWHQTPAWSTQYVAIAILCGIVFAFSGGLCGFFLLAAVVEATSIRPSAIVAVLFLAGGFVGSGVLGGWLVSRYRRHLHYAATDRRIVYCRGLLRPSCRSVPWTEISRIEYRSRPGRGDDVTFPGVPRATRLLQGEGLTFRGLENARRATRRLRELREGARDEPDVAEPLDTVPRSSLPETVRGRLQEGESLVYTTEPEARYETMTGTPLIVATVSLTALVVIGSAVASAFLWVTVPVLWIGVAGAVVGVATWYLLRAFERRHYEAGVVVVTDRQVIRYDGTSDEVESLAWRDAEGVITDDGHPKVLEREEPVPGQHSQHYVGLTVPATDRQEPVYRRLRQLYERRG